MVTKKELDEARLESQKAWDKHNKLFSEWYLDDFMKSSLGKRIIQSSNQKVRI